LALAFCLPAHAAGLTPILVSNGTSFMTCDGISRTMNTTPLGGKEVVAAYLFGNLITPSGYGADVVMHSPTYEANYPPPYTGGPSSQWGAIGDLHIFSQPAGHSGGRQGESYRSFQPDGVVINDHVQIIAICWGGGTLEIYAQIWVRDAVS
jgi:hypothetical protein